jgi:hypothetical protein
MTDQCEEVALFNARLQKLGVDFVCTTTLPDTSACVSFLGTFQGKVVMWNMELTALKHQSNAASQQTTVNKSESGSSPFIEITAGREGVFPLNVGLDLAVIDETVIKKTIIMIRNYKRLVLGRIEFGSMHT